MPARNGQARTCNKGHRYTKSSDCPVCPMCAAQDKPENRFLTLLAAPARRALEGAGLTSLRELSQVSEAAILKLHGMGPASLPVLRNELQKAGFEFQPSK